MPLPSPIRALCRAHLILLHSVIRKILGEQYRSLSSSLCSFLHSLVNSSLLGPNVLLYTLFSNTVSLRSSLNVSDQVSHPYKTKGKIIVLHILLFKFLDNTLEVKPLACHRMVASIPWLQSSLNFFLYRIFICFGCSQIFKIFHPFKGKSIVTDI